jgi:heat shock protein HtpX
MKSRYAPDRGLSVRMGATMFLIGLLYVAVIAILLMIGVGWVFAMLIGVGGLWAQWYFSDRMALFAMKAREVTPEQAPQLHAIVDRLCVMADMPKPRVAIADADLPNAFATGRSPSRSVVCVTTGLLARLDNDEVEAVLSHELSHVAHRDVTVMTVASAAGVIAGFLTRAVMWGGLSRNRDSNSAMAGFAVLAAALLVYAVSFVLTRMLSRYRELAADRAGAMLTGQPTVLASALTKVSGSMAQIPAKDLRTAENFNAFFFAPALAPGQTLAALFATHPPLEKRLENLAKVAAQLGQ